MKKGPTKHSDTSSLNSITSKCFVAKCLCSCALEKKNILTVEKDGIIDNGVLGQYRNCCNEREKFVEIEVVEFPCRVEGGYTIGHNFTKQV